MIAETQRAKMAERLREAFTRMGYPESRGRHQRIADDFEVSRETVRKWEAGESIPETWRLGEISRRSGLDFQYLTTGEPTAVSEPQGPYDPTVEPGPGISARLPLVSWVQAGQWSNVFDPYQPGVAEKWIPVTRKYSRRAYCLRVRGDSMQSPEGDSFPDGSIICVEPELPAEHKRYVIVRLDDTEEATFKQLIIDGGKQYLRPLNPRYPIMPIEKSATFCGVVRQMIMDFT